MPIDIFHLSLNANKFLHRFMDNSSLLQLREVSTMTKQLADFSHQRFRKTLVSSLEISAEQTRTRVSFRYLFRNPGASNYRDYYASKTCFKCAMLDLNIADYWFSEYRKALVAIVNSTELAQLFEYLKLLTERTKIQALIISSCAMPETIGMCLSFIGRRIIPTVSITNPPGRDMNFAAYLQVVKQVKPQKILFTTQIFPKNTTEFVMELANQVQSISVSYGFPFFGTEMHPSPNIIEFTQEIAVRKCEKIEIVDLCSSRNLTVADTETLIKILHRNPEKMLSLSYCEVNSEPKDVQIGTYKFSSDERGWLTIKHIEMK